MFNQLFNQSKARRRYQNAPLLEERLRYLAYRSDQGIKRSLLREIASYQLILVKKLSLKKNKIITIEEINYIAHRWAVYSLRHSHFKNISCTSREERFIRYAIRWLSFLGRLEIPQPPPMPIQIIDFADYMRNEKGLGESWINRICQFEQDFFSQFKKDINHTLAHLTPDRLDKLLIKEFNKQAYSHRTIQLIAGKLRVFLRYAETRGWCHPELADSIKIPRSYKHQILPMSPSWEDVQQLLKTTEGNLPWNIRARAILLLLAVYGLRDSELRRLRFDDFDWNEGIFHIKRSKFGPTQKFPLVQTVGRALVRYIKKVRPRSSAHQEIFLTIQPPFRPLNSLFYIVNRRWKLLDVAIKHHGPHALRHACATRLINQGMSLKTIADHLGHRDLDTTRVYAKVDLSSLRKVANFSIGGLL